MKVIDISLECFFLPWRRAQIISLSIQLEAFYLDLMVIFFIPSFCKLITLIEAHLETSTALALLRVLDCDSQPYTQSVDLLQWIIMFSSEQLLSSLNPGVLHSSASQFFPAFPSRLGHPQLLIPAPLLSYELLRTYLQPEPCKQALLLASQASSMVRLSSDTGKSRQNCCVSCSICSLVAVLFIRTVLDMYHIPTQYYWDDTVMSFNYTTKPTHPSVRKYTLNKGQCVVFWPVKQQNRLSCVAYLGNIYFNNVHVFHSMRGNLRMIAYSLIIAILGI